MNTFVEQNSQGTLHFGTMQYVRQQYILRRLRFRNCNPFHSSIHDSNLPALYLQRFRDRRILLKLFVVEVIFFKIWTSFPSP